MLCFSNVSRTFNDDSLLFDEDFLFEEVGEKSILKADDLPKSKTGKVYNFNDQLNTKSIKNKSGFNKPTEQWINRCNGDKDSCSSCIDVEQISKL